MQQQKLRCLWDTLRMLADQLYTVLMTLVEGESFDILVGSGSGEGLAASTQTLGPLDDWKSKKIAQRNPFPWTRQAGRAARSSGTTGGPDGGVTRKEETHGMVSAIRWQKTSGWRRWKRFSLKNSSDIVNSNGHGWIHIKS